MQEGIVNVCFPLFAISRSTPQVLLLASKPSSQILNQFNPVTEVCVALEIWALKLV